MRRSRVLLGESTRHPRRRGMALRVSKPRLAPKKGDAISPLQCRERCFTWGGGYSDHSRSFILYRTHRWNRGDTAIAQRSGGEVGRATGKNSTAICQPSGWRDNRHRAVDGSPESRGRASTCAWSRGTRGCGGLGNRRPAATTAGCLRGRTPTSEPVCWPQPVPTVEHSWLSDRLDGVPAAGRIAHPRHKACRAISMMT